MSNVVHSRISYSAYESIGNESADGSSAAEGFSRSKEQPSPKSARDLKNVKNASRSGK